MRKRLDHQVNVRLRRAEYESLRAIADREELALAQIARAAVRAYLASIEQRRERLAVEAS